MEEGGLREKIKGLRGGGEKIKVLRGGGVEGRR